MLKFNWRRRHRALPSLFDPSRALDPLRQALLLLWLFLPLHVGAADDMVQERATEFRLGLEYLSLPGNETMGMLGAAYLFEIAPGLYFGPSAYGATSGKRGGFFTGGGELAYRLALFSKLELEAGLYVGGGGGAIALVGSGLMLRPHADLMWNFGSMRAGLSVSSVRFPDGDIDSNQIGLVLAFDDRFFHTAPDKVGEATTVEQRGGVGFDRIALYAGSYRPRPGVKDNTGASMGSIGLAGFRAEQSFGDRYRWGIEAAGAAKGSADGYAEVLGTLAVEVPEFPEYFSAGARLAVGLGGGGAVPVGGGLLGKASLYGTLHLTRDYYVTLEGGYLEAINGEFRSLFASLQVGLELDHPERGKSVGTIDGWRWTGSVQRYARADRRDGTNEGIDLLGLKIDYQLGGGFYASGQAHTAVGGGAGGFAVGLVGIGWETRLPVSALTAGVELLAGAAGGGGVKTEGGAIVQPMAYAGLDLGRGWNLRAGIGYVHSFKGALDSAVLDLSLGYAFGVARR